MDSEPDEHLEYDCDDAKEKAMDDSCRNSHNSKTCRTSFGDTAILFPRDRKDEFDPVIMRKSQTSIS